MEIFNLLISKLDIYFREKECIVRSKRLLDELFVFIWNGQRAEAQNGYNDDLVMAFAIGLFVRDTALKLRQQGLELNKASLNSMGKTKSQTAIYTQKNLQKNPWEMDLGKNGKVDLTWLIK